MASFEAIKLLVSDINSGNEFSNGDFLSAETINKIINGVLYAQENGESVTDELNSLSDSINNGVVTLSNKAKWERSSLHKGNNTPKYTYRVSSSTIITIDKDITLRCKEGFRIGVHTFNDIGDFESDSGWKTIFNLPANKKFKVCIARTTEDTSEIADFNTFISAVTYELDIVYKSKVSSKNTKYPIELHKRATHSQGGCLVGDRFIWQNSNNKHIFYVNIITGEFGAKWASSNGFTSQNVGHCNDMTYCVSDGNVYIVTMLDSGAIAYMNPNDLSYINSVYPKDSNGNAIISCSIAFDRLTESFILAGYNDWYFYVFDKEWNYVKTIIPTDTKRNTKQGIETDGNFIYRILTTDNGEIIIRYDMDGNYIDEIKIYQFSGCELEGISYDWDNGYFVCNVNKHIDGVEHVVVYGIVPGNDSWYACEYNNLIKRIIFNS